MANTAVIDNLRRNIQMVGQGAIGQKMKDQERKKDFADKIRTLLATSAVSGKMRPKVGADFNNLDLDNPDFGQVLGQLGGLYEPQPAKVSTSYSISPASMGDLKSARDILASDPNQYVGAGMATADPKEMNILGFHTGRKAGTGLFGSGYGPGSKNATPTLGPEATGIQDAARKLLQNPQRVTQRVSGQVLGAGDTQDATSSQEERFNQLLAEGKSEDEAYAILAQEG